MRFQKESLGEAASDILQLVPDHYSEVSTYQGEVIAPQFELLKILEEKGHLFIFTARDEKQSLQGYAVFTLAPHFHYSRIKIASSTLLYMRPETRGHGVSFIRFCDESMKNLGADGIQYSVTDQKDFSPVLKRMGFKKLETLYIRKF